MWITPIYSLVSLVTFIAGLPWWLSGKESACQCRRCGFDPWVRKIPWRRKWQPTAVFLPGESPWTEEPCGATTHGVSEWDMTWWLNHKAFIAFQDRTAGSWATVPCAPVFPGPLSHCRSEITSTSCPVGFSGGEDKVGNYSGFTTQIIGWFQESLSKLIWTYLGRLF